MRTVKVLIIIAIIFSAFFPAKAQLTLEECQRLAQENYPLIHRYDLIRQTSDLTISNIGKGWLPQLSLSGQATYQSDVMNLPDMLQNLLNSNGYDYRGLKKDQYKVTIDLNQTIYDGGNINAQKEVAKRDLEVGQRQTDLDMYNLRERINNLYFGLLLLEKKIILNEQLQQLLSANCSKLEAMLEGGIAMQADVDAISAELLSTKQQNIELCSSRTCFQNMLALFIGKDITDILVIPKATMPVTNKNMHPELNLFDAHINKIEAQKKLLDTSINPRINLFMQGWYGYPGMDMFSDMFSRNWTLNGLAGVKLSWNIGAFYTRKNDKHKLDVSINEVENARETFLFNNKLQYTQEMSAIEKYSSLVLEDTKIVNLRTSVRKTAEAKLNHGIIDVNDLLREITYENQARINQSVHEIEMLKAIYEIKNTINQ